VKLTVSAAIDDPHLLGAGFRGASWATWRAVLRASEGLPLSLEQLELFRQVADRDPPGKRVRELWAIAGRRSGKDSVASAIAAVVAMGDHRAHLRPGERASVLCLAVDRQQAKIVNRYIRGYFNNNPLLQSLVTKETDDGLELNNGVEIVVATNSFRAVRGRTIVCAIFDECAYWRSEESANPDKEIYNAITPGLITLPGAMLIGISSPYRRSGLLFDRWRKHYGQPSDDVLVVKGPSTTFNPTLSVSYFDAQYEHDAEAASAEWGAEWRSDLADFISRDVVDSVVVPGRHELLPLPIAGVNYVAFCDPSGGSSDSMTIAIAHRDKDDTAILDAVRERRPPFRPDDVVQEFAGLLKTYRLNKVHGDRYAGEWPRERFQVHGITYLPADKPASAIYLELLLLLNSGKIELLDNQRLILQLCSLERQTSRSGRDNITHPVGGHDDLINAAAGALVMASAKTALVISDAALLRSRISGRYRSFNSNSGFGYTRF
jgi:hypothetical protein